MYLMDIDTYECDICGFQEKWNDHDDRRGDMWECENCMKHFCTDCFIKRHGSKAFHGMLGNAAFILCPDCFDKNVEGVKDDAESA